MNNINKQNINSGRNSQNRNVNSSKGNSYNTFFSRPSKIQTLSEVKKAQSK